MSIRILARGVSAVALTVAVPALADAPEDIVVTGQKLAEQAEVEINRTPGGVDVVSAGAFADKLAVSLRDTLAFSPGVYTQPRFGQEVRISIRGSGISRGFHMRGLMLFQDGIPINLADNNGDFQEFDPQVFERIEVYRGGNALKLGGSTLGGSINAVTPTGRSAQGIDLRVDGGSYDTIRGKAAIGFADGPGDAYLAVTTDNSDGDRDHARRHAIRFTGNAGLQLSPAVETRVYASVNHIVQRLPGALTRDQALDDPRLSLPGNIAGDQQRNIDSIRLQSRTRVDLGPGAIVFGAFLNDKQLSHPIFQVIDQKSVDYGAFGRIDWDAGWILASAGSTARFGHVQARQYVNVGGRKGARTADARQSAQTIDSYGELRVKPVPTLSLIAGGIHTHGEREVDNRLNPLRSGRAEFDSFSPKFGVLYEPREDLQLFANYSRSVELPGYSELNQTPFDASAPGFVDVDPQKAWTFEIGTRGTIGIAHWDLTFYRARIRGEMLQFSAGRVDIPAATFNADRTRHQGIEAGLDLALAPWARLRQVYQYNDFRFRGDATFGNSRLPVVAKHLYRADLRIGNEGLSITPNIEWVPEGAWADYANTAKAPGYTLFGIGAEAMLREGVTVFVDARNLTNKHAIGDISAVVAATDAAAIYYPVERRAMYGGVRARF
ncbi:TonB-dependent receptor family protein [Sphingomonas sp. ID0503]|uniref:TonB-dependent receptor family protein n=1 Tax=Sphingomonas sp. ID0503 TaxID=3399691 RepID=UPI003AFA27C0